MRWIYERIHYDPRPIDVAILGGSGAQLGFSAPAIERQFAKQGQDANVVNFAIFGRGRNIESVILDEIYKAKSPRTIVVEVYDPPYPFGHDLFRYVASAGAIVSAPKLALHYYFNNLTYRLSASSRCSAPISSPSVWALKAIRSRALRTKPRRLQHELYRRRQAG